MIICRRFKFAAAHRLPQYEGKCNNLHGHEWKVDIALSGDIKYGPSAGSEVGMVMDFGRLKDIVNEIIIDNFDHHYLNDVIAFTPTAENLAGFIFDELKEFLVQLEFVRVWESDDSYAEQRRTS